MPNRSLAPSLTPRTSEAMIADQLDALLGEHLMPLRARTPGTDEPYLLAVDASGQPVVVEVVAVLDEPAVLAALRHAGRAARMSTRDLAQAYQGGPERFASHLAAFRLTVPTTALLSTFVRGGARLLLVCSHVSPGAADVLEFMLQPGWHVDVLRAQVVTDPDGRRVVELSPVARPMPPEREVELPDWGRPERSADPMFDPTPLFRATPRPRLDRPGAQPWRDMLRDAPQADPWAARGAEGWQASEGRPAPVVPPLAQVGPGVPAVVSPLRDEPARPEPLRVDPVLVALAEALEGPAPLVWCPQAGVCFEAVLQPDGVVELADGTRFGDIEAVTRAISGVEGPVDAWDVWRVDSTVGPTLAELARAVFPEQF